MKIKVLIDTSSGISRKEANELGFELLALPFLLDDVEYDEDKLTKSEFYEKLKNAKEVHTSSATIENITKTVDKLLETCDAVLYFPITSGLSSSYDNAVAISEREKYKGKLIVVDHRTISVVERAMLMDVKKLLEKGLNALKIKELIEGNSKNNRVYIAVDTLEYLKKGGRISSLSSAIGSILNVKPVLFSNGGKFEVVRKARGFKAAEDELKNLVRNDFKEYFKDENMNDYVLGIAYTECIDEATKFKDIMEEEFGTKFILDELSTVIGCHIGTGAIAAAIYKVLDEC